MKAKDLRVGNLVDRGIIYEIRNRVARIKYSDRYSLISYEDLQPIPLTEEILIELGFELDAKNNEYPFKFIKNKGMSYEVEIENLNSTTCFILSHGRRFSLVKIEYVHQLQNLYYSLTGNELK